MSSPAQSSGINLIPACRRAAGRRTARIRLWLCIAPLCISSLAGSYGYFAATWDTRTDELQRRLASSDDRVSRADHAAAAARAQAVELNAQLKAARVISGQPDWGRFLSVLAERLADRAVLSELKLDPVQPPGAGGAAKPAESTPRASWYRLSLSGMARAQQGVSDLLLDLSGCKLFQDVKLLESRRSTFLSAEAYTFQIECMISDPPDQAPPAK